MTAVADSGSMRLPSGASFQPSGPSKRALSDEIAFFFIKKLLAENGMVWNNSEIPKNPQIRNFE